MENMDSQSLLDLLNNFFEYVKNDVFNGELHGLILHLFSYIPSEIRSVFFVGLILVIFAGIINALGK